MPVWSVCDLEQVADRLDSQMGDTEFDDDSDTPIVVADLDPGVARSQNTVMHIYSNIMSNGLSQVIAVDGPSERIVVHVESVNTNDISDQMRDLFNDRGNGGIATVKFAANLAIKGQMTSDAFALMRAVDAEGPLSQTKGALREIKNLFNKNTQSFKGVIGVAVLVFAVAMVTVALVGYLSGDEALQAVFASVLYVGTVVFGVLWPIRGATLLVKFGGAASFGSALLKSSQLVGFTNKAAVVGLVLSIGLAWGFFIYGVVSGGATFYSAEFNQALASTIATTIFAVLMFALALTVVGLIIVGIVAAIDGLLYLLCEYADFKPEELSGLSDGGCFTLSGAAIKGITAVVYAYDLMVDAEADDLVEVGDVDIALRDEAVGYQVGNAIDVTLPITTNVRHLDPAVSSWQILPYLWFYSKSNLTSSTMDYSLTSPDTATLSAERGTMVASWAPPTVHDTYVSKEMYETSTSEELSIGLDFDTAGVNERFDVHLNYAYAFPASECWTIPQPFIPPFFVPICYKRTFDGNDSSSFDPRVYDVLPATLDEFIAVSSRAGGGHGLAWDDAFAALPDADFDGLLAASAGGLDPDDTDWDTDNDGLSDAYELAQQQKGSAISPRFWDTDNDGLTDAQELRLGTDPGVADTDNDGLSDGEEVRHLFVLERRPCGMAPGQAAGTCRSSPMSSTMAVLGL